MKQYEFISKNEADTKQLAKKLAAKLKPKDVVVLTGELGSGKTKFTEGFLSYFGLENEISSPTLSDSSEFYEIGGEEYFENGICLIEWGELIEDALPNDYIHITFKKDDKNENNRILIIESKEDLF